MTKIECQTAKQINNNNNKTRMQAFVALNEEKTENKLRGINTSSFQFLCMCVLFC